MSNIAIDLVLLITAALIGGLFARVLKQPLVIGYIFAGILVGPHTGGATVSNVDNISHLADIGAALLLFSLGLEFSLRDLKPIWRVALIGSSLQVMFTFVYGFGVVTIIGWDLIPALWLGGAIVSSSTALILRTLEDRGFRKTLSGKIMLGVSIVQDLLVIPILILLISVNFSGFSLQTLARPLFSSTVFLLIMGLLATRLIPVLLHRIARLNSSELFMLSTISIGLGIGYFSYQFGLSAAFGAFVAGLVLSESDFGHKALSEMVPFRDLFGMMFFASIGMLFDPDFVLGNMKSIFGLLVIITGGKGVILAFIALVFGYRRIIPLAMMFGMVPISEMAFVLARNGLEIGALAQQNYQIILNVVVLSMIAGPVAAGLATPIYRLMRKFRPASEIQLRNFPEQGFNNHVVVSGSGSFVEYLAIELKGVDLPFLIIEPFYKDFYSLAASEFPVIFGEPDKTDILQAAGIGKASLLILFESDAFSASAVIEKAQAQNHSINIIYLSRSDFLIDSSKTGNLDVIVFEKQIAEKTASLALNKLLRKK